MRPVPPGEITRVEPQDERQPGQAGDLGHLVEGARLSATAIGLVLVAEVGPADRARAQDVRAERADERDLEQHVDGRPDKDRDDHGAGQVALWVVGLTPNCTACSKPEQGEHDPSGRDRDQDALDRRAVDEEAATAGEVGAVEVGDQQTMIVRTGMNTFHEVIAVVGPGQPPDPDHVHDHEHDHQDDRDRVMPTTVQRAAGSPFALAMTKKWRAQWSLDRYWIAASTSIGATVAACR